MKSPARPASGGPPPSRNARWDRGILLAFLILVLALSATALGWYHTREAARTANRERFLDCINELLLIINQAVTTREGILRGGAAMFRASKEVSAREWRNYVSSLALRDDFPDILAMGYAPLVPSDGLSAIEAFAKEQSITDFRFHPKTSQAFHLPVLYLESLRQDQRRLVGFDLQSDPSARQATEQARTSGTTVITFSPMLHELLGPPDDLQLLLVHPVFLTQSATTNNDRSVMGFVFSRLDIGRIIESSLGDRLLEFEVQIYDADTPSVLLYDSRSRHPRTEQHFAAMSETRPITAAGDKWLVRFSTLPRFEKRLPLETDEIVLAAGVAISLLLFTISLALATTRQRANQVAEEVNRAYVEERARLQEITSTLGEGLYVQNADGVITFSNPAAEQILGYSRGELLGRSSSEIIDPDFLATRVGLNEHALGRREGKHREPEETVFLHASGSPIPVSVVSSPILRNGDPTGSVIAFQDISERKRAESALRISQQFEALFHYSSDALFLVDMDGRISDANRVAQHSLGYSRDELVGSPLSRFVRWATVPPPGQTLSGYFASMDPEALVRGEAEHVRKNGSSFFVGLAFRVIGMEERKQIFVSAHDITERKDAERRIQQALDELEQSRRDVEDANRRLAESNQELQRLSRHDGLTKIPNRRSFDEYLDLEWSRASRDQRPLSLMIADVDYFKFFNDRYGHQAGDDCLRRVAASLSQQLSRSIDMVARYGGEEFVIVLPETPLPGATNIAERLRNAVAEMNIPHAASKVSDRVTISIGVAAVVPRLGVSRDRLVSAADAALYKAKEQGRNQVCSVAMTNG